MGYWVNSKIGTRFRILATQRLKEFLVQGYAVNQERFEKNAAELQQALALIQKVAQSPALAADMGREAFGYPGPLYPDISFAATTR